MPNKNKNTRDFLNTFNEIYELSDDRDISRRYKKLLPQTIRNMETKLSEFVKNYNNERLDMNPCEKFAVRQLIKIARSVCTTSLRGTKLTADYFEEINKDITNLITETVEKSPVHPTLLEKLTRKFLLITCDAARILALIENQRNSISLDALDLKNTEQDLAAYIRRNLNKKFSPTNHSIKQSQLIINKGERLYNISIQPPEQKSSESKSISQHPYLPQEDDFKIIKLISQGAYGAVYLVEHNPTHKQYAMKKIIKSHAILKNQVRQVFAERDILSFIDNPFVISMFCSFETHNAFCMVMEYAEGGDCASLLKYVSVLPLEISRVFIAETIIALEYIHNYGIVHRDIKPDNLLITSLGHIKLTDFGLSKIVTTYDFNETENNFTDLDIQGTPNYIAPEIILNMPYGKVVDYWSVGIVLYEFLVGCTPFMGSSVEEVFEAIISSPIEWPQGNDAVDPCAQEIISRFLDRDPNKRLGHFGAKEIKSHTFFKEVRWNFLLHSKAQFIEMRNNDSEDSCFDDRCYRYQHHEILSNDSEDTPISPQTSFQSFTSYTKRFKNAIDDTSVFTTDNESTIFKQDETFETKVNTGDISVTAFNSVNNDSQLTLSLKKFIHIIPIDSRNVKLNVGISINTVRVICQKNITFLLHIIDCIVPNSLAEKAGLKSGQAVIFLNNNLMVGEQHIFVIKYLLYEIIESIGVCFLDEIGITHSKNFETFTMDTKSVFFKLLVKSRIHFERIVDYQTFPVKLTFKADIEDLNDSFSMESQNSVTGNIDSSVSGVFSTNSNANDKTEAENTIEPLVSLSNNIITNEQSKKIERQNNSFKRHTISDIPSQRIIIPKSYSHISKFRIKIRSDENETPFHKDYIVDRDSEAHHTRIKTRSRSDEILNIEEENFSE